MCCLLWHSFKSLYSWTSQFWRRTPVNRAWVAQWSRYFGEEWAGCAPNCLSVHHSLSYCSTLLHPRILLLHCWQAVIASPLSWGSQISRWVVVIWGHKGLSSVCGFIEANHSLTRNTLLFHFMTEIKNQFPSIMLGCINAQGECRARNASWEDASWQDQTHRSSIIV